jgi:hypothetical protein
MGSQLKGHNIKKLGLWAIIIICEYLRTSSITPPHDQNINYITALKVFWWCGLLIVANSKVRH